MNLKGPADKLSLSQLAISIDCTMTHGYPRIEFVIRRT